MARRNWTTAKAVKPARDLVEIFDEVEQGSDEWHRLHVGVPSAGAFGAIMAESAERKMRATLLNAMVSAIRWYGNGNETPLVGYTNAAMERGHVMEPAALEHFAFMHGVELRRVGFVRRTISRPFPFNDDPLVVGCSPDALVGDDGLVEIKTMEPRLIEDLICSGRPPTNFRWQVQGQLWVTGRTKLRLKIFYEGYPDSPEYTFERNEADIARLRKEVDIFDYELRQRVRARKERT